MRSILYIVIASGLLLNSCSLIRKKTIDTGRIEYKITYLTTNEGGFDPTLLPKKLILEFNPNNCTNTIQGFMGVFQLSTFIEFQKKKAKTHMKVANEHYIYEGIRNEMMCCFDPMDDIQYKFDTVTRDIAGLHSKRVNVNIPSAGKEYSVYFTNDIKLPNANANNPYKFIDGVLTSFQLWSNGYTMQFEATRYLPNAPAKYKFTSPKEYKEVNRNQLTYIFNRLLSTK